MKDKICATLTKEHIYQCSTKMIGRSGENECTQLEITLDECLCNKWVYIDFCKPDGTTYKTPKLEVVDNKVTYDVPNTLLNQRGFLKVQVVIQDETGEIWKSNIKSYEVNPSINATDDIPNQDDFITEAQKLLDEGYKLKEEIETNIQPILEETIEKSNEALENSETALSIVEEVKNTNLSEYVKSSKDNNIVYCKYEYKDYGIEFSSSSPKAYTMVRRDSRGGVITAEPTRDDEATTKKYVDNKFKHYGNESGSFANGILYITGNDMENSLGRLYDYVSEWAKKNTNANDHFIAISTYDNTKHFIYEYLDFSNLAQGVYFIIAEYIVP